MALRLVLCLVLVAASNGQYPVASNTKGTTIQNYGPFDYDVKDYVKATVTMTEILDNAKKNTATSLKEAKRLYEQQTVGTDPKVPLKSYANLWYGNWSSTSNQAQLFWALSRSFHGSLSFSDNYFGKFTSPIAVETGLLWSAVLWFGSQLDTARYLMTDAGKARYKTKTPVEALDGAAALFISFSTNQTLSLYHFHHEVRLHFRDGACMKSVDHSVNKPVIKIMNTMKGQAKLRDMQGFNASYDQLWEAMCAGHLRGMLWQVELQTIESQAFAYGYLSPCAPVFKNVAEVKALRALLAGPQVAPIKVVRDKVVAIAKQGTRARGQDMSNYLFCATTP